jgi:hypothetical protein
MIKDYTNNWTSTINDVKPLLGDRFYFDLINNLDNEKYQPLLDGCAFTYFGISYARWY